VLALAALGQAGPDLPTTPAAGCSCRLVPVSGWIVCAQVIARCATVFDHPLCRRQDQGTLAETTKSDLIEFPFDRITSWCRPTTFRVLGCRGLVGVLLAGPGGSVRPQGAHRGGEQAGFGGHMPAISEGVQPA